MWNILKLEQAES